jgi:hypothetical protein
MKCRIKEPVHLYHFAGYGDEARTWVNTAFEAEPEEPKPVSNKSKLIDIARRLKSRT